MVETETTAIGRRLLVQLLEELHRWRTYSSYFVVCFCKDANLLSQWRAYGKSGGYALGLRTNDLSRTAVSVGKDIQPIRFSLKKVNYDADWHREIVNTVLSEALTVIRQMPDDYPRDPTDIPVIGAIVFINQCRSELLSQTKNPAFHQEDEWRLVGSFPYRISPKHSDMIQFRSAESVLVPYVPVYFAEPEKIELHRASKSPPPLPLKSIVIGPMAHEIIAEDSVRVLTKKTKYPGVEIRRSSIPLRNI